MLTTVILRQINRLFYLCALRRQWYRVDCFLCMLHAARAAAVTKSRHATGSARKGCHDQRGSFQLFCNFLIVCGFDRFMVYSCSARLYLATPTRARSALETKAENRKR
jgi:hypothetical protein